ncbi:MAG TPA: OmpA family protein, partial [Gemmatimonadales bacterium]
MKPVSLLFVIGLGVAVAAGACGGNPPPETAPQPNADSIAAAQAEAERLAREEAERRAREEAERAAREREAMTASARTTEEVRNMVAVMIHFDYDKSNIRSDDAGALDQKVAILQANPNLRIRIHGHCDERGSDEYNLALGNRRAQSAKQYLVSHGIEAGRID